jgi:hypothetical protein
VELDAKRGGALITAMAFQTHLMLANCSHQSCSFGSSFLMRTARGGLAGARY